MKMSSCRACLEGGSVTQHCPHDVDSPPGEHFSGSCTVTSRNSLIHNGATNGTKAGRFDPKGVQQGLLSRACRCVEEPLATANFGESPKGEVRRIHLPRTIFYEVGGIRLCLLG